MVTLTGERLIDVAASYVKWFFELYSPERVYVLVSGGKDSIAALVAATYAGDSIAKRLVVVYNELAGNTHPVNRGVVYAVADRLGFTDRVVVKSPPYVSVRAAASKANFVHIVAYNRKGEDFWRSVERWAIPVRLRSGRRWCYAEFKQKHWQRLPHFNGRRFFIVGVKMSDSPHRRKYLSQNLDSSKVWLTVRVSSRRIDYQLLPLLRLDSTHVWDILAEAGVRKIVERPYSRCGDSLNCMFCPMRALRKQEEIVKCLAGDKYGRSVLLRARSALSKIPSNNVSYEKARKWIEMIDLALGDSHDMGV